MSEDQITLSVVVAAYNEEAVIIRNLQRITEELSTRPDMKWEIVCVNDGSEDRTGLLMEEVAAEEPKIRILHHRRNFGQGRALRTAFDTCRGEVFVTLDADLSYEPEYIYRLIDALNGTKADIALASPFMKGGMVHNVPFYRHFLSRIGNYYLARMSHYPISTSTSVMRAYRREVLDTLILTSNGMEIQLEILMKASIMGFRVCEIPAHLEWADDKAKEANLRRVSKMRILQTVRLYLQMGWLSRPAYFFIIMALLLILPGLYMASWLVWSIFGAVRQYLEAGENIRWAISYGLEDIFTGYVYSFAISGILIIVGLQLLIFALLFIQNKFYFDELYRISQQILKGHRK